MTRSTALILVTLFLVFGICQRVEAQAEETPAAGSPATLLLQDPVDLDLYEVPSQALPQWYAARSKRPALLLYSNEPFLLPTHSAVEKNLRQALNNQDHKAFQFGTPNPAILPEMTLAGALDAGIFSSIYWILPSDEEFSALSVETFRSQLLQVGGISQEEAQSFILRDGVFSGKLRGIPFYAVHRKADFKIDGPVVFHLDLSYFSPLYKGEFKTPLFNLVYETFKHLQEKQLRTVAVGFSYSQISGRIPLGSRFLGNIVQQLFKQPHLLDEKLPANWQHRANALYLPNMFITEGARNILLQMADSQPDDASLHYALYQISRESSTHRAVALRHLADAVQRDPVYSYEYLILATLAFEKNRSDDALRVLRLASEATPENPFTSLRYVRALLDQGQTATAVPRLKALLSLNWSNTFYPDMPAYLEQLLAEANP